MGLSMQVVVVGLCLILGTFTVVQSAEKNECQKSVESLTPRHFLNLTQFLGTWYVHKFGMGNSEDVHEPDYKCLAVNFSKTSAGNNTLNAQENYLQIADGGLKEVTTSNDVVVGNLDNPAVWTMYSNSTSTGEPLTTESVIVASNYESYAIQYSCYIRNGKKFEAGTIFTRQRVFGARLVNVLQSLLVGLGFPESNLIPIDQTGCDQ